MKPIVTFEDFAKLDLRVGKIIHAEIKEGSEKLLRLKVDFGEEGERIILSGIQQWYTPEDLVGKSYIFIINLEPKKIMGEESQGMILAADGEKPLPLTTEEEVPAGSPIR